MLKPTTLTARYFRQATLKMRQLPESLEYQNMCCVCLTDDIGPLYKAGTRRHVTKALERTLRQTDVDSRRCYR